MNNPLLMYAPYSPGAPQFGPINECIDCVTDWVTRYLGDATFIYTHNAVRIWGGPNEPTIRDLVSQYINGIISAHNSYYGTPSALDYRNIYNQLLDSYNSLDYNTLEQRWAVLKQQNPSQYNDTPIYNCTSTSGCTPKHLWQNDMINQAAHRADYLLFQNVGTNSYFGLGKFLEGNRWFTRSQIVSAYWGQDGQGGSPPPINAIFREYIRCFLRLFKSIYIDYPDFNGGSKKKNRKTKKHKNKKIKKINKNKKSKRN